MSDYAKEVRKRGQNLLVVEGNHEKNKLFALVFRCFPEIGISMEDIWIYGTNIYMLYEDIVKEYGETWTEDDIDLPFVISRKQSKKEVCYKDDFVNIILVFDYERHDPNFSEEKICKMQDYFADAADVGRLYINYPMIESYQHLRKLPDEDYAERKVPVSLQPGRKYKALVKNETGIGSLIEFPHKMKELFVERFGVIELLQNEQCCEEILELADGNCLEEKVRQVLQKVIGGDVLETAVRQISVMLSRLGYVDEGRTYWECMRLIFKQIILHNISKANRIQNGQYRIRSGNYRDCFESLDMSDILEAQNRSSQNTENGFIWVLNTSIFFVAEYNFSLVD